jgi:YVTN family beta-propeller protein
VIETIDVGDSPRLPVYNPSNDDVYVVNQLSDDISVIDSATNSVIETIDGLFGPYDLIFNPSNNNIYVVNSESQSVSVIDSTNNSVIKTIVILINPISLLYNPFNNNIYIGNSFGSDNLIDIIDSTSNNYKGYIAVGPGPFKMVFNPSNNNIYVGNSESDSVSVIATTLNEVLKPVADAGTDQSVKSGDVVQLDGSNSSDSNNSPLVYNWTQTSGPDVTLIDSTSSNPTFMAPQTIDQIDLIFQLVVTNEEGISSEADEVIITVNPIFTPPPPQEESRTIGHIIKGMIQNPLNVTNSIDSANEIRDILTDDNNDNDQLVCDLINSENEYTSNIREILNC